MTASYKKFLFYTLLMLAGLAAMLLFYKENLLLTSAFLIAGLIVWKFWYKENDMYFFLIGGAAGTIAELSSVYVGIWSYSAPAFLGIPMWVPITWGLTAVLVKRMVAALTDPDKS